METETDLIHLLVSFFDYQAKFVKKITLNTDTVKLIIWSVRSCPILLRGEKKGKISCDNQLILQPGFNCICLCDYWPISNYFGRIKGEIYYDRRFGPNISVHIQDMSNEQWLRDDWNNRSFYENLYLSVEKVEEDDKVIMLSLLDRNPILVPSLFTLSLEKLPLLYLTKDQYEEFLSGKIAQKFLKLDIFSMNKAVRFFKDPSLFNEPEAYSSACRYLFEPYVHKSFVNKYSSMRQLVDLETDHIGTKFRLMLLRYPTLTSYAKMLLVDHWNETHAYHPVSDLLEEDIEERISENEYMTL